MHIESMTFFRPDAVTRKASVLPAQTYNHIRLLLNRSVTECQFVPIRTLQYMGVIARQEVIFVDSQSYAIREGEGGRMVMLAWEFDKMGSRDTLNEPLPFEVVHYYEGLNDVELRLYREFDDAMQLLLERQLEADQARQKAKVISIQS